MFFAGLACSTGLSQTYDDAHRLGHGRLVNELDENEYAQNVSVIRRFVDEMRVVEGERVGGKMQMMAAGERRYLFQRGTAGEPAARIWDVTEPLDTHVIGENTFGGPLFRSSNQIQVAYSQSAGKWILISGDQKGGRAAGLRGIRIYDVSDPLNIVHLADWSTDRGHPDRPFQEGEGTHRNYYDGGKYAYLDTQMDNSFSNGERGRVNGVQIIDVEDPSEPRFVSYWWVPGMHADEEEEYRRWREYGDGASSTSHHGPFYVPERVEDGGRYSYSTWGSFGFMIHDLADIENPALIGQWRPEEYRPSRHIAFHGTNLAFLDRGFVITNPEAIIPHCLAGPLHDSYVIDVRDKSNPKLLSILPIPMPPEEAPYDHFCDKRGRFSTHNMPHLKAPGRPHPTITAYTYFNGGLQFYDLSDASNPEIVGYFVPRQGGTIDNVFSYYRDSDNVFIEWDRRLVWLASNTGLYLLSTPLLGAPMLDPMPVTEWAAPGVNVGFEEFEQ